MIPDISNSLATSLATSLYGIRCVGVQVKGKFESFYIREYRNTKLFFPDGYKALSVKSSKENVIVSCEVCAVNSLPQLICKANDECFTSYTITIAVNQVLEKIGCVSKKHWSGYDFFGFHRKEVLQKYQVGEPNETSATTRCKKPLIDIENILSRNAGPTTDLKSKKVSQGLSQE